MLTAVVDVVRVRNDKDLYVVSGRGPLFLLTVWIQVNLVSETVYEWCIVKSNRCTSCYQGGPRREEALCGEFCRPSCLLCFG